MVSFFYKISIILVGIVFVDNIAAYNNKRTEPPSLIVFLVIDQLRSDAAMDMPFFKKTRFYREAYYDHACTETAVGHATLLSGRTPASHGIIANSWYEQGGSVYTKAGKVKTVKNIGGGGAQASPAQFTGNHLSIAFKSQYPHSKFISLSWKDRAAVMMGGPKADIALWAGKNSFISSSYYTDETPGWLQEFNLKNPFEDYAGREWTVTLNDGTIKKDKVASHGKNWSKVLAYTPFADKLTLSLAGHIIRSQKLGTKNEPDFLAISLSGNDYLAHSKSYNSDEVKANLLNLSDALKQFTAETQSALGKRRVVFLLSADHGGTNIQLNAQKMGQSPLLINQDHFFRIVKLRLKVRYRQIDDLLKFRNPHFYLHKEKLIQHKINEAAFVEHLKEAVLRSNYIYSVVDMHKLKNNPGQSVVYSPVKLPHGLKIDAQSMHGYALNCYSPEKSPDLFVTLLPNAYLTDTGFTYVAGHGSAFRDDRKVPIAIWGDGFTPQVIDRTVNVRQIVRTLAGFGRVKYEPGESVPDKLE